VLVQIEVLLRMLANAREYSVGDGETLPLRVRACCHGARHARGLSSREPDLAIFNHHALVEPHFQSRRRELVNGGMRFLVWNDVSSEDLHGVLTVASEHGVHDCRYGALQGGVAYHDLDCVGKRFINQGFDAGAHGEVSRFDELDEEVSLACVLCGDELSLVWLRDASWPSDSVEVVCDSALADVEVEDRIEVVYVPVHL
jgi:hypothetical protein